MTIEGVVIIVLIAAVVFGWMFFRKGTSSIISVDTKKIATDFDEKKKAEAQRIDQEPPSALRDDFNSGK